MTVSSGIEKSAKKQFVTLGQSGHVREKGRSPVIRVGKTTLAQRMDGKITCAFTGPSSTMSVNPGGDKAALGVS